MLCATLLKGVCRRKPGCCTVCVHDARAIAELGNSTITLATLAKHIKEGIAAEKLTRGQTNAICKQNPAGMRALSRWEASQSISDHLNQTVRL